MDLNTQVVQEQNGEDDHGASQKNPVEATGHHQTPEAVGDGQEEEHESNGRHTHHHKPGRRI